MSLSSLESPQFKKFTIDSNYTLTRTCKDGTKKVITDPVKRQKYLQEGYFDGSIAYSRDTRHCTLLHKIIFVFQKIMLFLTGRSSSSLDANVCHGAIIISHAKPGSKGPLPFLVADAVLPGVLTRVWDPIQDDATSYDIYRPTDSGLRDQLKTNALRTSVPRKIEHKKDGVTPEKKHEFSYYGMITCIFHRKIRVVRGAEKTVPDHIKRRTASIVADLLLKKQPQDAKGRPIDFYCASYVASLLQGSLFLNALKDVSHRDIEEFCSDPQGYPLKRDHLITKIVKYMSKDDHVCRVGSRIHELYIKQKIAQWDSSRPVSCHLVAKLEKLSRRNPPKYPPKEIRPNLVCA